MIRLNQSDMEEIRARGSRVSDVEAQIETFRRGAPYLELVRPCTVGDGIRRLGAGEQERFIRLYEDSLGGLEVVKFVPASGAASRMFRALQKTRNELGEVRVESVEAALADTRDTAEQMLTFMEGIRRFAFFDDLKIVMEAGGQDIEKQIDAGDFTNILDFLLTEKGLHYAALPKGLLKFHAYPDGARTAFEEHLVEAAGYAQSKDGVCRLHLTVSDEHLTGFRRWLSDVRRRYERTWGAAYQVDFSTQDPSTDTLAVDLENRPFRDVDGRLLFRPGGHGALIANLDRLSADLIFIKNIDNVVVDRLKEPMLRWKQVLAGYLLGIQREVFEHAKALNGTPLNDGQMKATHAFIRDELGVETLAAELAGSLEERRRVFLDLLERPLRVCGMVKNVGEPGGGPFWVRDGRGRVTRQIVETAQVNPDSVRQQAHLRSATHFNPVDIVCAVRKVDGRPFELRRFVDQEAVLISRKSKGGKDLKALELPGLWNGGMAGWNTVFVEVPLATFSPVKTVTDLLRDAHQSSGSSV